MRTASASDGLIPAEGVRLFWFIQTYRDIRRLMRVLSGVRAHYPDSQVLVVSDGDPDPAIPGVCDDHKVNFVLRPPLFGVEHGGAPVHAMLEAFLATDADVLIKIDPDTHVRRRLSVLAPASDGSIYGTLQEAGSDANRLVSVQGGCVVVPRLAAFRLADSALLKSDRLRPPALEWAVNDVLLGRARSGLTTYDWTLGWACRELGIQVRNHPDIFSRHQPGLRRTIRSLCAAICHPRFELGQLANPLFYVR